MLCTRSSLSPCGVPNHLLYLVGFEFYYKDHSFLFDTIGLWATRVHEFSGLVKVARISRPFRLALLFLMFPSAKQVATGGGVMQSAREPPTVPASPVAMGSRKQAGTKHAPVRRSSCCTGCYLRGLVKSGFPGFWGCLSRSYIAIYIYIICDTAVDRVVCYDAIFPLTLQHSHIMHEVPCIIRVLLLHIIYFMQASHFSLL